MRIHITQTANKDKTFLTIYTDNTKTQITFNKAETRELIQRIQRINPKQENEPNKNKHNENKN